MLAAAAIAAQRKGRSAHAPCRRSCSTVCRATVINSDALKERERADHHGFMKGDPDFDVTNASCLGASVVVEFKKRPSGVKRYSHGANGKGAIVLDMQDSSRYPGDPKGQAFLGGVKKNMVIKSVAGQNCLDWPFGEIMELFDDYDFEPTDTADVKTGWVARERKHQAAALPVAVEFVECNADEVDEDTVAPQEEGKWYPRSSGYTPAQLDEELARARREFPAPSNYSGVSYTGPACLTDAWIQSFMEQQSRGILLPQQMAYHLVIDAIKVLSNEKTMGEVQIQPGGKLTVCGDTHGQYWDIMNLFKMNGLPSASNPYVFNGDFVDRGSWGMENICLIYAMKIKDPSSLHLNRGNHELIEANLIYGFAGECMKKYDAKIFDLFSESFRKLSLCHLLNKQILCCHGGVPGPNPRIYVPGMSHDPSDAIPVSVSTLKLADIAAVDRETELQSATYKNAVLILEEGVQLPAPEKVSEDRIIIDLIWSDPRGTAGYGPSYRKTRGVYMFGPDVTAKFCADNNLKYVIRSHEVKEMGWKQDHPQLFTVFSAPDYMDTGGNKGAYLTVSNIGGELTVTPTEFEKSSHPDTPPMIWQKHFDEVCPHLTKKMTKRKGPQYDSNGMLVTMSAAEMEDAQNQWVEDDDDDDIDGVPPGQSLAAKGRA